MGGDNETDDAVNELVGMINSTLGPYLLPNNPDNALPTIGEMVAAGHRAVVTLQRDDVAAKTTFLWPGYECNTPPPPHALSSDAVSVLSGYCGSSPR